MRHVIHGGPDTFFTPETALLEFLMGRVEGQGGREADCPREDERERDSEQCGERVTRGREAMWIGSKTRLLSKPIPLSSLRGSLLWKAFITSVRGYIDILT